MQTNPIKSREFHRRGMKAADRIARVIEPASRRSIARVDDIGAGDNYKQVHIVFFFSLHACPL